MSKSYLTAIKRNKPSLPLRKLLDLGLVGGRVLDYGCGRGDDCDALGCDGFDPYFRPTPPVGEYDTVLCTFVLNVIKDPKIRSKIIRTVLSLLRTNGKAFFTVRRDTPNKGWGRSSKGTWQEYVELDFPIVYECSAFVIYEAS